MNQKYREAFYTSAGLILLATSAFGFFGNLQHPELQPVEPMFGISSSYIFRTLALIEACIAFICLFARSPMLKHVLVLWFSSGTLVYGFSQFCMDVKTLNAYYYSIAIRFGLGIELLGMFHSFAMIYLLVGSFLCIFKPTAIKNPNDDPGQDANHISPQKELCH